MILRDERAGLEHRLGEGGARLGRDPDLDIVFPDSEDVVSAIHCRVIQKGAEWWLEDLGSTNGTWVEGRRIGDPVKLTTGMRFSLGQRGPVLRVTIPGQVARTMAEPSREVQGPQLRLRRVKGGEDLVASGSEIVVGRSSACAIPLRSVADTVVSKRHAVITLDPGGDATIQDVGSRNGTFLNGRPVRARTALRLGDRVMLGWEGPVFEVRALGAASMKDGEGAPYQPKREPPRTFSGMMAVAEEQARRASTMRTGVFVKSMAQQLATASSIAFRVAVVALFLGMVGAIIYIYRLSAERTAQAEEQLASAERNFSRQMEAEQQRSHGEITQLQRDLAKARAAAVSRAVLDSLERRLADAEAAAARAPGGSGEAAVTPHDFTGVARDNSRAVGLVIAKFASADSITGSGFAITPSGYFVTCRHVVFDTLRGQAQRVSVVMAETNVVLPADIAVVSTSQGHDVAILRVRGFHGTPVQAIDWTGRDAVQGAPAAMLGFPFGVQFSADPGGFVHSSLFAGYIAATSGEWVRISANTYFGTSGSPVFNSQGEVIAVHFGQPSSGAGLGISVPMSKVRHWLPAEAKSELGL